MSNDKVRILLVDDQRPRLLSYQSMLSSLGHELDYASSGTEALQMLMRSDYAVVVLDVNMPIMDGFETAHMVRQHPRFEKTPIIFVTAFHFNDLDRLKAYELGAVDYVSLPVVPAILRSKISVLVELYCKRRDLQELNEHLKLANTRLGEANHSLQEERTREQNRFTSTLEAANAELARSNEVLRAEASVRQRVENALRNSEGRLRAILQNTSALIYQMDLEGRFVHVNRMFEQLFHCSNEELHGQSVHDVFPREVAATIAANNRAVLERCHSVEFEETLLLDGERRVFTSVKAPLTDDTGSPCGIVGVSTDITERQLLVEALKEADRRKDEFLALLAHELRNPLAPIVNAAEVMRLKGLEDKDLVWCSAVIERQAKHLTRLVDDLLDVSRIASGKVNLQKTWLEVAELLPRAIEINRPLLETRRQELIVEVPPEPLRLLGDLTRLAQVVANLLNNASKYSPEGGKIWLSVETTVPDGDDSGPEVLIRVKDHGRGISPDFLPRMFDLFAQADQTLERAQGGLGVGLALVHRLVEMHGGSVTASSEGVGRGSEFVVRLPLSAEETNESAAPPPSTTRVSPGRGLRILIVDDNLDSATSLSLLLRQESNTVQVAHDGLAGLELAERFRPEVLLLDLGMPQMNGYDLARRIRERAWGKEALLIAMTGWSQDEVRAQTREAGFDLHMVKPLDSAALTKLLGAVNEGLRPTPVAPTRSSPSEGSLHVVDR